MVDIVAPDSIASWSGQIHGSGGNVVASVSGNYVNALISGTVVTSISGATISGQDVRLSGTVAQITSGVVQAYLSGGTASLSGLILTSGVFFASGIGVTLSGTVAQVTSGVVQAYLSGGTASLSGLILTSGIFFASGIGITLSGSTAQITSGVVQIYSGLVSILQVVASGVAFIQAGAAFSNQSGISGSTAVIQMGTQAKMYVQPGSSGLITFLSGGVQFSSGQCAEVILRNRGDGQVVSGNIFYIGASGANTSPASGFGFPLLSGETLTIHIDNLSKINAWAASSGAILRWMAT